ncbi:MAG: stage III sporulation protein AG [Clostridiales bacterium]|jgi:stage III sporulation protein AG|nr:stage III sporulation protein AG [Eubacteriales bacterium]MDH7565237.1 stage III sporulation protein AG [Clostridiales bacterium]
MGQLKRIKEFFNSLLSSKNKRKIIENALIVIAIGIILVIAGGAFFQKDSSKTPAPNPDEGMTGQEVGKMMAGNDKSDIEKELEEILSQIKGAGRVSVMITYESGKEIVPATDASKKENDVQEKDSGGGSRNTSQDEYETKIVFEEQSGIKKPVVLKELQPAVKGVIVVAEGATDPSVRENLSKAVQVITGVPIHKVQVFERTK